MHAKPPDRKPLIVLAILIGLCWAPGIALISVGNARAAQDYYYSVIPWAFWGCILLAVPFLYIIIVCGIRMLRMLGRDLRRYGAWKAALPPGQRTAVELAELAALTGAAVAAHEHHKRASARLTASVMGQRGPELDPLPPAGFPPRSRLPLREPPGSGGAMPPG